MPADEEELVSIIGDLLTALNPPLTSSDTSAMAFRIEHPEWVKQAKDAVNRAGGV